MATAAAARERIDVQVPADGRRGHELQEAIRRSLVCGIHLPYQRLEDFFVSASRLLKPGGAFAIIDWFKKENPRVQKPRNLSSHRKRHLCELQIMDDYEQYLISTACRSRTAKF